MNVAILCGRATKDPEVRYTQGAEPMAVARFTLAVDRPKKDAEQTADFINIVAFGKRGEFVEKYIKKGTKIIVSGRIQTGSYTNKEGQKVYTTEVIADSMEFAESKQTDIASKINAPVEVEPDFSQVSIDEDLPFARI